MLALYRNLITAWNQRNARDFAECFDGAGNVVGFDGSQLEGRAAIEAELARIFQDHKPARFVAIVREIRPLGADTTLLRAVAGMVPEGGASINAAVNAIQSMVARHAGGTWKIALFQNTPAALHGRPELAQALTRELQAALDDMQ
jgi:uncharacterized protein (TIGR02246 family)